MPRETARQKADRLLVEGRLIVHRAGPHFAAATVRGEGTVHHCGFHHGTWFCTCPVRTDQCSHLHALRRVTAPDLPDP